MRPMRTWCAWYTKWFRGSACGRAQKVALPHGYLDDRDDDTPPRSPPPAEEIEGWERALSGG